jgi:predicted nucleic acid-binding protein
MNSLDTNVLIYAFDPSEPEKHAVAARLLCVACAESWPICSQVYGEFFTATVRKGIATRLLAFETVLHWQSLMPTLPSNTEAHRVALQLATQNQLQYWDALIIATCAEHGVKTLYTEDLPSLKKPAGVSVENPFKKARKR